MKKKRQTLILETNQVLEPIGLPIIPNDSKNPDKGYFFTLNNAGKKTRNNEYIYETKEFRVDHGVISKDNVSISIDMTVKELEKLLKKAKKQQQRFKENFYLHFNPNLSIFFSK